MNRCLTIACGGLALLWAGTADAQVYQVYYPAPTTVYYQPAPAPVTTYYAPAPRTVYYAPAPVAVAPAPVVTTYYRPLLGGTITRTRYVYAPVTYAAPATVYYRAY